MLSICRGRLNRRPDTFKGLNLKNKLSRVGGVLGASLVALGFAMAPASTAGAQEAADFSATTPEDHRSAAPGQVNSGDGAPASRFIVTFNKMATLDQDRRMQLLDNIVKEYSSDASFVREMFDGSYVVTLDPPVPAEKVPSLRGTLESKAEIAYADIDRVQYSTASPNDDLYQEQWHLHNEKDNHGVDAEGAWDTGATGEGTVIAVVDTGITDHEDLNGKVLDGLDFISNSWTAQDGNGRDYDPTDEGDYNDTDACRQSYSSWHGTHVAGIAAAETNNRYGVAGVAPDAEILPVRVLGRCGGYTSDIIDGMVWASGGYVPHTPRNRTPADVINLSLGGPQRCSETPYQAAIDAAIRNGATITVAAGNDNTWSDGFAPASCRGVITVGATGPHGHRSSYSNFGDNVDIGAPGGDMSPVTGGFNRAGSILSTVNAGQYNPTNPTFAYMDGTSMATPVVSGVVALMKSVNPALSNDEIERILKETSTSYTREPYSAWKTSRELGAGIVNARAAVAAVRGPEPQDEPEEVFEPTAPATPAPAPKPREPKKNSDGECKVAKSIFEKLSPGNWC